MNLYRYKNVWGELILDEWVCEKETDKSLHLSLKDNPKEKKMMRRNAKGRFARETKEEALDDFILRKESEMKILKRRQEAVEKVLVRANTAREVK